MEFCPKCDSRLRPKLKDEGEEVLIICSKCGYQKSSEFSAIVPKVSEPKSEEPIIVIGKKEQKLQTLPTISKECPKCNNNLAYVWQVQTRSSDESSTLFFRCTKYNYTFREYN
jgi:DNA-directed RNA polymerase subunit M